MNAAALSYIERYMGGLFMWKKFAGTRKTFLPVFLTGFAAGILYMVFFGRAAAHETTLMSRYFFSRYQQVELASGELLWYILKSRVSFFTLLWLTGFTFFGTTAAFLSLAWMGAALGITLTTAAMKLGFMGILICLASGLPQVFLYVPALAWLLQKICETSENRPWKGQRYSGNSRQMMPYLLVWGLGFLLLLAGSLLESYVNPIFLKLILKNI